MRRGRKNVSPSTKRNRPMLVLTRRATQRILLPSVPASVQVLAVRAGAVRLGIDAPRHVTVVREEVADDSPASPSRHALRNHLNNLSLALGLLRVQLTQAPRQELRHTLDGMEEEVRMLAGWLDS